MFCVLCSRHLRDFAEVHLAAMKSCICCLSTGEEISFVFNVKYVSNLCRGEAISPFLPRNSCDDEEKPSKISMTVVVVSHDGLPRSRFRSSYCCHKLVRSGPRPAQLYSWCAQTVTRLTSVVVHQPGCLRHISNTITTLSLAFLNEQCTEKVHPQWCLSICWRR